MHPLWWNFGAAEPLAGRHRWFPQHFGGRKQIILETIFLQNKKKTQNKAISSFSFSNNKCSPRQLWVPIAVMTTLTYLRWLKGPRMSYTPTRMMKKKQEIINTYLIIIFRVTTISY